MDDLSKLFSKMDVIGAHQPYTVRVHPPVSKGGGRRSHQGGIDSKKVGFLLDSSKKNLLLELYGRSRVEADIITIKINDITKDLDHNILGRQILNIPHLHLNKKKMHKLRKPQLLEPKIK